jgi:lysophospholipase L1-like esterase
VRLVRYCHPAKILAATRLPGLATLDEPTLALLYGVSTERYRDIAGAIRAEAARAARELDAPVFTAGGPVLAVGDSHTDDLGSWAEILAARLDVPVINAGLSGDTTTAARARLSQLPAAGHAFVLLGTNDARRHGEQDMLVSHGETRRNLRAIDHDLRRRCDQVTWITPPPVDEQRIRGAPALRAADVTWRLDDVAAKAALVREAWPDAIDVWPLFTADHLSDDGLHVSAAGQRLIAERALRRLARRTAARARRQRIR